MDRLGDPHPFCFEGHLTSLQIENFLISISPLKSSLGCWELLEGEENCKPELCANTKTWSPLGLATTKLPCIASLLVPTSPLTNNRLGLSIPSLSLAAQARVVKDAIGPTA